MKRMRGEGLLGDLSEEILQSNWLQLVVKAMKEMATRMKDRATMILLNHGQLIHIFSCV